MEDVINSTINFVKKKLSGAEAGHDWFHIERVWKLSKMIAKEENADMLVVELAALLHDIADSKFHNGNEQFALEISREWLEKNKISEDVIIKILFIIRHISFKNRHEYFENMPVEFKIVQDADRLDAIGAIGIARAFNFGGFKNNLMYHPEILPNLNMMKEEYKKSHGTTINHFYEKLLLLKDLMNTETAKKIAFERHNFMLSFLNEFYREWNVDLENITS